MRAGNADRARKFVGKAADIDVHSWLSKQIAELEKSLHGEGIREAHAKSLRERGYSKSDISVPFMSGFSIDYQDGSNFVADLVCPVIPGDVSRKFTKFSRRDASRIVETRLMSSKSEPRVAGIDVNNDTYSEVAHGLMQEVANSDLADASDIPELMMAHARALYGDLKRAREKRVLDLLMVSGSFASGCTSALSSTNRWDVSPATSTADPVKDIRITAGTAVGMARAFNTMLIGKVAFEYLRTHPKVIAAAGAKSSDRVLDSSDLASLFGLQNIFVADAKYDSAGNSGTASYAYLAPKSCALIYVQPGASRNELSFAKTFRHHQMRYEDIEDRKKGLDGVTYLKLTHADAEKVVASDCGYLLDTVIS